MIEIEVLMELQAFSRRLVVMVVIYICGISDYGSDGESVDATALFAGVIAK